MGIRDIFRRRRRGDGSGRGQRGVRGARVEHAGPGRRRDQPTQAMNLPGQQPPAPAPGPAGPPPSRPSPAATVVTPRVEPMAPAPAPAPGPAAPPASGGSNSDAGATRYYSVPSARVGRVVGVLIAVEGELEGEVYRVADGESRIGRSRDCEVVLASEWVSRHHAKIVHMSGQFVIGPLSDKNPTLVNDQATEGSELKDGDYIRVGKTTLRFRTVL